MLPTRSFALCKTFGRQQGVIEQTNVCVIVVICDSFPAAVAAVQWGPVGLMHNCELPYSKFMYTAMTKYAGRSLLLHRGIQVAKIVQVSDAFKR